MELDVVMLDLLPFEASGLRPCEPSTCGGGKETCPTTRLEVQE
jgi:hypothetical protein